jgi:hypothetical protein
MPNTVDDLVTGRTQIGKELATLDFANLIGGPLNAVVEAQAKAALTTVNFIKEVAFDPEGKARQVSFSYVRRDTDGKTREYNLQVPFLTMLPIPYIAVKKATIDFNAKITSTTQADSSESLKTDTNAGAGGSWWFAKAKLETKVAYQKTTSSSVKEERTYDLHINVEACNDEMPAGTERLLTILEQSIGENKGPEVFILPLAPRTKASNKVHLQEALPESSTLFNESFALTLPAVSKDGVPLGALPCTVKVPIKENAKSNGLAFDFDDKYDGALLAPNVGTITINPDKKAPTNPDKKAPTEEKSVNTEG